MKAAVTPSRPSHQSKANAHHIARGSASRGVALKPPQAQSIVFEDKRPEAVAQRKLHALANNSPQVRQLQAFQDMANDSLQAKQAAQFQKTIQRKIYVNSVDNGDAFEDLGDWVNPKWGFSKKDKAKYRNWIKDNDEHRYTTLPKLLEAITGKKRKARTAKDKIEHEARRKYGPDLKKITDTRAGYLASIQANIKDGKDSWKRLNSAKSKAGMSTWARSNWETWGEMKTAANEQLNVYEDAVAKWSQVSENDVKALQDIKYNAPIDVEQFNSVNATYKKIVAIDKEIAEASDELEVRTVAIEAKIEPKGKKGSKAKRSRIKRSVLNREYPYGSANTTPHIHHYGDSYHLKAHDRGSIKRYNIIQNGQRRSQYKDALRVAKGKVKEIVDAILEKYGY